MFESPAGEARPSPSELARLLDEAPVGITVQAADGRLVFVNREALASFGFDSEEALLRLPPGELAARYEIYDAHDAPLPADRLPGRLALRGLRVPEQILRFRRKGTRQDHVMRMRAAPVLGENGQVRFAINAWTDVTELTQTREELRVRTALLEAETELTTQGILHAGPEARLLSCNAQLCQILGLSREQILGRDEREFLRGLAARVSHGRALAALAEGPLPRARLHTRVLFRDRRSFELTGVPLFGPGERFFGRIWFVRELTRERLLERRRRHTVRDHAALLLAEARQQRSAFLAEASHRLAHDLDPGSSLRSVARLSVPFLADACVIDLVGPGGLLQRQAVATGPGTAKLSALWSCPARLTRGSELAAVVRTGALREGRLDRPERLFGDCAEEVRRIGADRYLCVPLSGRDQVLGVLTLLFLPGRPATGIDPRFAEALASRMAAAVENALLYRRAVDAVRSRDEFLSVAAHELRTPVTALQFALQLLKRAVGPRGRRGRLAGALGIAERQGKRLAKLIDNLFEVSQVQTTPLALRLERVDLSALVRQTAERLKGELAAAGCALALSADAPVVGRWDRGRVEQIVTNLISNAAKYGAGRPIELRVSGGEGRARVEVADHGIGIPHAEQARIFDRYERGVSAWNYGGLGLGLFIARQLVQALGGSVAVQSEPGAGAVFTVDLPMEGPRPLPLAERAADGGSR